MVLPVVVAYSILSMVAFGLMSAKSMKPLDRFEVANQLDAKGGKHLVFVNYSEDHNYFKEWVYNQADIDSSKIVWANTLSDQENEQLAKYYDGRSIWVWHADEPQLNLHPFQRSSTQTVKP
jgi:hypothetical protein